MADLQPYCFESERIPNPEDSESENEEANDRLKGTFWYNLGISILVEFY